MYELSIHAKGYCGVYIKKILDLVLSTFFGKKTVSDKIPDRSETCVLIFSVVFVDRL